MKANTKRKPATASNVVAIASASEDAPMARADRAVAEMGSRTLEDFIALRDECGKSFGRDRHKMSLGALMFDAATSGETGCPVYGVLAGILADLDVLTFCDVDSLDDGALALVLSNARRRIRLAMELSERLNRAAKGGAS